MTERPDGVPAALADTTVFIARPGDRPLRTAPPRRVAVSIVTIGELRAGLLAATDAVTRARRLRTLTAAATLDPIPIDDAVAASWAELWVTLRDAGRSLPVNRAWIAATALAHELPVATQDDSYDGVPGLEVIKL